MHGCVDTVISTCVRRESTSGREDIEVAVAAAVSVAAMKWMVGGVRRIVGETEKGE